MRLHTTVLLVLVLCAFLKGNAQDSSFYAKLHQLPDKLFSRINAKSQYLERKLDRQTEKYLARLEKQEKRLQCKLWKKDSAAANAIFGDVTNRYSKLHKNVTTQNIYSGHLDSMQMAMRFLQQQSSLPLNEKYQSVLSNYSQLQEKLNDAATIKKYLKERQQYLKQQLQQFGLAKQFRKFEKDVYYYRAQVDEYKRMLDDPSKLEAKLLQLAPKIPAFKDFFSKNSLLASLFRLPGNDPVASAAPIPGLQTRASVQQVMVQRFGSGPDVSRAMYYLKAYKNDASLVSSVTIKKGTQFAIGGVENGTGTQIFIPRDQQNGKVVYSAVSNLLK